MLTLKNVCKFHTYFSFFLVLLSQWKLRIGFLIH